MRRLSSLFLEPMKELLLRSFSFDSKKIQKY